MSEIEYQGKVTIYTRSGFSLEMVAIEATKFMAAHRQYAQYSNAIAMRWVKKRKRKASCAVDTDYPATVVLEGWGHFDPSFSETVYDDGDCVMRRVGYRSLDQCDRDFATMLDDYLHRTGTRVILDTRGNDPHAVCAGV